MHPIERAKPPEVQPMERLHSGGAINDDDR